MDGISPSTTSCKFGSRGFPRIESFEADYILRRVDDQSTRYVAQENVILLDKDELNAMGDIVDRFPIEIGMWFRRYDAASGRFVSNIKQEYPED
jgi:hypothetical protein